MESLGVKVQRQHKSVLVTGSEGYIGAVLVPLLLEQGYTVHGLDTLYFGRINHVHERFFFHEVDIRDTEKIPLKGIDAIIHLAGLSNDPMGALNPNLTEEINQRATIRLAKKAKEMGVKRFLFSSSCSIYGIAQDGFVDETSAVHPLTAYAESKLKSEKALCELGNDAFTVGILRNSTVYGWSPNIRLDLVVNNLSACAYATNELRIMSDGTPWRPLIDVRDVSRAFLTFLEAKSEIINGVLFNIGFEENNVQVKDIVEYVSKQKPQCGVVFTGEHGADTRSYKVSFARFRSSFPLFSQHYPLSVSIADLFEQFARIHLTSVQFKTHRFERVSALKLLLEEHKIDEELRQIV